MAASKRTAFCFCRRSKHQSTAVSNSPRISKKRLCIGKRRASFQTRSMGVSCGLYGGRNGKVGTLSYPSSKGASSQACRYFALSRTITMRLARERCRRSLLRRVSRNRPMAGSFSISSFSPQYRHHRGTCFLPAVSHRPAVRGRSCTDSAPPALLAAFCRHDP